MSILIGKGTSFCQEEMEKKEEVLVIPYVMEINKDLLPAYEADKESFSAALDPYLRYLEKKVGVKYKEEVLSTEEIITLLRKGEIGEKKLVLFRLLTYLKAHKEFGFVAFTRAVYGTSETFKKIILVRRDSGIKTLEDLRGKRFIAPCDRKDMGYLFTWALLSKKKGVKDLNDFFGEIIRPRVYKDKSLVLGVLLKEADVTCVADVTFNVMCKLNPRIGKELLILAQSEPFVPPPHAYSPGFIDEYGEKRLLKLKEELLRMHQIPEGDQILLTFTIRRFVEARDSDYDNHKQMIKDIGVELDDLLDLVD